MIITQIAGGESHSVALAPDQTARAWGNGAFGTLGSDATDYHSTPVAVSIPSGADSCRSPPFRARITLATGLPQTKGRCLKASVAYGTQSASRIKPE